VGRKPAKMCASAGFVLHRHPDISRQSCKAANRNLVQGRTGQASEHNITKPFPTSRSGKRRACAAKHHVLIQGDPVGVSGSRACPKANVVLVAAQLDFLAVWFYGFSSYSYSASRYSYSYSMASSATACVRWINRVSIDCLAVRDRKLERPS
jgi:hypothetical protein